MKDKICSCGLRYLPFSSKRRIRRLLKETKNRLKIETKNLKKEILKLQIEDIEWLL